MNAKYFEDVKLSNKTLDNRAIDPFNIFLNEI